MKIRNIKIISDAVNSKGDLFSRLIGDLFYSLGYDNLRFDVHKAGREIDITAYHRTEAKVAFAECKAHENPIGGDDINKFVGALGVEKSKLQKESSKEVEVVGYFVSISGFKQTAIEQEIDAGNNRVILLDKEKIVRELIAGKILVRIEEAIRQVSLKLDGTNLASFVDLFAHEKGWIWVIYYTNGQHLTHYAFVHAEGKPLVREIADEIIAQNDLFSKLDYINNNTLVDNTVLIRDKYYKYLKNECGEIHFDGLPIDKDSGSTKVKLEDIFVPLFLVESISPQGVSRSLGRPRLGIGSVLSKNKRIAILAKPGGGKSTLIKRLAIAYAFSDRRKLVDDSLPELDLFPIFIRCRELGELVKHSITDIISSIPNRAEIGYLKDDFGILVSDSLQKGNALILIDGLDEISDERNRIIFVNQLRTFLSTYPDLFVIITSREVGFRSVSGALSNHCSRYNLANLSNQEIETLCIKWHKAIIDDSASTLIEAKSLASLIIKDKRITVLARNPLMLTTLLFVKRYIGYLPTKRNQLYHEMIKLLLVTWNVEGYEQLDIEESEPQLAYVAFWMMQKGQQTISAEELRSCLAAARHQMPEVFDYTKISVTEFIRRVESRSSLLIMSGHKNTVNGLSPIYEFLHLNFQEYLAAKAIAEGTLPSTESNKTVVEIIEPYIMLQNWREVIPLLAILLKRQAKPLIEYITNRTKDISVQNDYYNDDWLTVDDSNTDSSTANKRVIRQSRENIPRILGSCLANEVQINPDTLEKAIEWYVKTVNDSQEAEVVETIINSKFGDLFVKKVSNLFFEEFHNQHSVSVASVCALIQLSLIRNKNEQVSFEKILQNLYDSQDTQKCLAILALTEFSFEYQKNKSETILLFDKEKLFNEFELILNSDSDGYLSFSASWALSWIWANDFFNLETKSKEILIILLIKKWIHSKIDDTARFACWALSENLDPIYNINFLKEIENFDEYFKNKFYNFINIEEKYTALYVCINLGIKLDIPEIRTALNECDHSLANRNRTDQIYANHLGIQIEDGDLQSTEDFDNDTPF